LHISEVHSVGILQAGDDFGTILDFQVGLHEFNVHNLALGGPIAFSTEPIKLEVSVVSKEKAGNGVIHELKSSLLVWTSENRLKTLSATLMQLNFRP